MNLPVRKSLPHAIPHWVTEDSSYFITINCDPRNQNHLCLPDPDNKVLEAAKYNHENSIWHCRLILLMPDHLHAIINFPRDPGLQTTLSNWKKYLARTANITWQKDFFDHRLRDHHQLTEKTTYILQNPIRRGLCQKIEDWPWQYRGE
jgi:putative transposase